MSKTLIKINMKVYWLLVTERIQDKLKCETPLDPKYVAEVCRNCKDNKRILKIKDKCMESVLKQLKRRGMEPVESVEKYIVSK